MDPRESLRKNVSIVTPCFLKATLWKRKLPCSGAGEREVQIQKSADVGPGRLLCFLSQEQCIWKMGTRLIPQAKYQPNRGCSLMKEQGNIFKTLAPHQRAKVSSHGLFHRHPQLYLCPWWQECICLVLEWHRRTSLSKVPLWSLNQKGVSSRYYSLNSIQDLVTRQQVYSGSPREAFPIGSQLVRDVVCVSWKSLVLLLGLIRIGGLGECTKGDLASSDRVEVPRCSC